MLLFLLLSFLPPEEVLVLKNGQKIQCISHEEKGAMLLIQTSERQFSLPLKMVDWEKTASYKQQQEARAAAREQATQDALNVDKNREKAQRASMQSLRDYSELGDRVELAHQTIKGFTVVQGFLDGAGPMDLIIYEKSPRSMLSRHLVERFKLEAVGQTTMTHGMDKGKTVPTFLLNDARIDLAQAKDLEVAMCRMPKLPGVHIVAILGSDFFAGYDLIRDPSFIQIRKKDEVIVDRGRIDFTPYWHYKQNLRAVKPVLEQVQARFVAGAFEEEALIAVESKLEALWERTGYLSKIEREMEQWPRPEYAKPQQCMKPFSSLNIALQDYYVLMRPALKNKTDAQFRAIGQAWQQLQEAFEAAVGCYENDDFPPKPQ